MVRFEVPSRYPEFLALRCSTEDREQLAEAAKREGVPVSAFVRTLIRDGLAREGYRAAA